MKNKLTAPNDHLSTGAYYKRTNLLLTAIAFIFMSCAMSSCKDNKTTPAEQATKSTDSLHASMDSLQSQYNASRGQIDQLTTRTAKLDSLIKLKDAEIAKLNVKIKHLQRNNKELAKKLKSDDKLIASLKNDLNEKDKSYSDKLSSLENDKSNLVRERDSLMNKYNHLKELGSVLHASNIRIEALHLKHHGRTEKNTKRARKADMLRVLFDIDENRIAEDGTKQLYLVIKDPDGQLLSSASNGSGITTTSNGHQMHFSILKEVSLKQNEPVSGVSVNWKQDDDYKKGEYDIAIYNGGYKIGSGRVILN